MASLYCMSYSTTRMSTIATSSGRRCRKMVCTIEGTAKHKAVIIVYVVKKSIYITRIEPVGKPYREVCLQTLLWPWKVHQPSSWLLYLSELALKLKEKKFYLLFFLFLNGFLGCIEHTFNKWTQKKKESWVFVGFDPGTSESGVWRSTNWATRDNLTGQ